MVYLMPAKKKEKIDDKLLREAVAAAERQPRLAFYSPVASAVLNYWKSTIPRFSISELLAMMVEKELAKRWPQLYRKAKEMLEYKSSRKKKRRVGKV